MKHSNYKDAGVDIEKGDELVSKIKARVKRTYGEEVKSGVGGFASLYAHGDSYLAAGTDGVGTKLKLAFDLDIHHTIGIDLVAMCVNDVLCTGAKPLFFLDYLATGKLEVEKAQAIIEGIADGCEQSECALIGGETAEMPGMYAAGEYDLAGFSVGSVLKNNLLTSEGLAPNMSLIGLPSSGFHSNGYSLIRSFLSEEDHELKKELLKPTRIYWKTLKPLLESKLITALAHITGGGLKNISRLSDQLDFEVDYTEVEKSRPHEMNVILDRANLDPFEAYQTFNMGIGMVLVTENKDELIKCLREMNEPFYLLGETKSGSGKVHLKNRDLTF